MSSSKDSLSSSQGSHAHVQFPFEIEPPIEKLTFGHQYAIQGIPLTQSITFHNKTNDIYKMKIIPSTSPKYSMEID